MMWFKLIVCIIFVFICINIIIDSAKTNSYLKKIEKHRLEIAKIYVDKKTKEMILELQPKIDETLNKVKEVLGNE